MFDRNLAYGSHGSRRTRSRRAKRRRIGSILAVGACIGVLVAGYFLLSPRATHATSAADVQGFQQGAYGWGEGGYPMMSGPPDGTANGEPANGGAANGGGANGTVNGQAGPAASAASAASAAAVTQVTSANWAGYAAAGGAGSFTSVSASWAQPAVSCGGTDTFSAFWAGLDGDGTATVEQTGVEADCAGGTATYQGWYELFPNAPVFYANPVQPGDAMSASVVSDGGGLFTLTLSDATQGWTQATQQTAANAQLGSAEVIAEAPSGDSVLPLADFGTVNFTGVTADGAPIGNSAGLSELTMESAAGTVLAAPSALSSAGAFSVTAETGGTTAAGPGGPGTGTGTGGGSSGDGSRHHRRGWDLGF
jgi:hypothetical protein